jgi:hypothetical protein
MMAWNTDPRLPWTPAEDDLLWELAAARATVRDMAWAIGRSKSAVFRRLERLDCKPNPKQKPSLRLCLRCRRDFMSDGAHNRLCKTCRALSATLSPFEPDIA